MRDAAGPPSEVIELLEARRREVALALSELAEPVRAPGVQMQFGKRAGDHTSDAVLEMTRTITSGELSSLAAEIDRALAKIEEGSYGRCDRCGTSIPQERLEALPWATLCVACKGAALPGGQPA